MPASRSTSWCNGWWRTPRSIADAIGAGGPDPKELGRDRAPRHGDARARAAACPGRGGAPAPSHDDLRRCLTGMQRICRAGPALAATLALLLASLGLGIVKGSTSTSSRRCRTSRDAAANRVGFRITDVALAGDTRAQPRRDAGDRPASPAAPRCCSSMPRATRARLKANPWIAEADGAQALSRPAADRRSRERTAFALWQKDGRVS